MRKGDLGEGMGKRGVVDEEGGEKLYDKKRCEKLL